MKGLFDVCDFCVNYLLNHSKVDECFKGFGELEKWAQSSVYLTLVVTSTK